LQVGETIAAGARVERKLLIEPWYVLITTGNPSDAIAELSRDKRVEYAEIDSPVFLLDPTEEPDFDQQWALENLPSKGGHWDADIDAVEAWDLGATGAGITVAVIDTGVNMDLLELAGQVWTNADEIPGNGIDDDNNGFVDDVNGANSVWLNGDIADPDGHGTACAGIIAATEDQRFIVGLAKDAAIMPVRIFGRGEEGSFVSHAADGIAYAVANGAHVLSNSWTTGTGKKRLITEAIELAHDNNVLFVAAAGNSPVDADIEGFFPATSNLDNVISVAASDRFDQLVDRPGLWGSTFGLESVDLTAPGEGILAPTLDDDVLLFSGTSAAAPLVAATVALLLSKDPDLDNLQVKQLILDTVDWNESPTLTGGRLNAGKAVRLLVDGVGSYRPEISVDGDIALDAALDLYVADAENCDWFLPDTSTAMDGTQLSYAFSTPGEWMLVAECTDALGQVGRAQHPISIPIPWLEWELIPVESLHDVVNEGIYELHAPPGTQWARFHFSEIDLNSAGVGKADAYVTIYDSEQLWVWSATDQHQDLWTPPLRGDQFTIYWAIDESALPSWGFHLDAAESWRDAIPFPLELDVGLPTSRLEPDSKGCRHGSQPGSWSSWFLLMALFWARVRSREQLSHLEHRRVL